MQAVDHHGVLRLIAEDAQIVDVLPAHEYDAAHLPGAIHLPLRNLLRDARRKLAFDRPIVVYCRDSLCDLSARAAAQLEYLGCGGIFPYPRGKADWLMRGLPTEPRAGIVERARPLPYFINNLLPGLRSGWIAMTKRTRVDQFMHDDLPRMCPEDKLAASISMRRAAPHAVVLNGDGVLLGAIEGAIGEGHAIEHVNGGPQTIRPDMTPALATWLLKDHDYILVTTAMGKYLGRYAADQRSITPSREMSR